MQAPKAIGRTLLVAWLLHAAFSYAFAAYTGGLAYEDGDSPSGISYVRDLQSSGGDDNICVAVGVVLGAAGLALGGIRYRARFGVADAVANGTLIALQTVYIAAIEMGSIWVTIARTANIALACWLVSLVAIWGCVAAAGFEIALRRGIAKHEA